MAVGEPGGWRAAVGRAAQGCLDRLGATLALGVTQCRRLRQERLSLLPQGGQRLATRQELLCRGAYQLHPDLALPPALAAKAVGDRWENPRDGCKGLGDGQLENDAAFAAALSGLLENAGVDYKAQVIGDGAIAQGAGAKAVGRGGVMVDGDVKEDITIGK